MIEDRNRSVYRLARMAVVGKYGPDFGYGVRGILLDVALGEFSPDDGLQQIRAKCDRVLGLMDPDADEEQMRRDLLAIELREVDT